MTTSAVPRCVALVGPRGAGKTVVAAELASVLAWARLDGDELLAEAAGRSAAECLVELGEAGFRALEERVTTAALATAEQAVIALGGGAVLSRAIRTALGEPDVFPVFLHAAPEVLTERIRRDATARPALTGLPLEREVVALLRERLPLYRAVARLELDTAARFPEECAREIVAALPRVD